MHRKDPICLTIALLTTAVLAKDTRWISTSDPYWQTEDNWANGVPANIVEPTNVKALFDHAYFRDPAGSVITNILLQEDVYIGSIRFTPLNSTTPPANYTIGTPDGPTIHLTCTSGDFETHCNAGAHPNVTQTIAAPLKIYANYQFYTESTDPSSTFVLGDISSGAASGAIEIQLKGDNTGDNRINGVISDGASSTVKITKINGGWWTLSGQSTYSGVTQVSVGTLIAGADIPASGPSPFGTYNAANAIRLGYPNPINAAWSRPCRILAGTKPDGTPVTINRRIDIQTNNKLADWPQDTCLGGANTDGTSHFQGIISNYRPLHLVCATGGTVAFDGPDNQWSVRDRPVIVGTPEFGGTVSLVSKFITNNSLAVSNGILRVDGPVKANSVTVAPGATLSGSGTLHCLTDTLTIEPGATLAAPSSGTLILQNTPILAPEAILELPGTQCETPALVVQGQLSLDDVKITLRRNPSDPEQRYVVARATDGITGSPDLSLLPAACTLTLSATEIEFSFLQPTRIILR